MECGFCSRKTFFELLESNHGGIPWDNNENNSMFIAERMFLITALHHAIENLQKLNIEIQRENGDSLQNVISSIEVVVLLQDIKNLRDMNEHKFDYLVE